MVLHRAGEPLRAARAAGARAGAGQVLLEVARLRRLPHRPARGRRGAARPEAAARAGPPDRRPVCSRAGERFAPGRPRRRAVARLDLRRVPLLPRRGRENLCDRARFTGYDLDGGYAELAVADERFCFPIPDGYPDLQAAPLLCAGLIGYRALRPGRRRRAARPLRLRRGGAHRLPGGAPPGPARVRVHARRRRGRAGLRASSWARSGRATRAARRPRSSTPRSSSRRSGELVPAALRAIGQGRAWWCARGIHMSDIPSFPYELLWGERVAALGGQPHPRATARSSWRWRRRCRCAPRWRRTRSARRTRRSNAARRRGPGRGGAGALSASGRRGRPRREISRQAALTRRMRGRARASRRRNSGERFGHGAPDAGVHGHAAVAACAPPPGVGARVEARVPVHDAVALRVDRDEADARGQRTGWRPRSRRSSRRRGRCA